MSHQNSGCPACQARGYALGGIVARETSNGEFSGSTSSIGANHDGLTISSGSIHGSSSSQSLLAQQLGCPGRTAIEPGNPHVMTMLASGFGVIMGCTLPSVLGALGGDAPSSDSNFGAPMSSINGLMGLAPSILIGASIIAFAWSAFSAINYTPGPDDIKKFKHQVKIDDAVQAIYPRLRYCAADHIVFDPTTNETCQPEAESLRRMLFSIAEA